jgi:hypothetical protein
VPGTSSGEAARDSKHRPFGYGLSDLRLATLGGCIRSSVGLQNGQGK